MKTGILCILGTAALLVQGFCSPVFGADAPVKTSRPAIYDENADAAKEIADALALAKKEDKRVLLQFGANWCGWCHKLHKLCQTDTYIAAKLKEAYVVVLVDVNKGHNSDINKQYRESHALWPARHRHSECGWNDSDHTGYRQAGGRRPPRPEESASLDFHGTQLT